MLCISVLNQTKISVQSISFRSLRCLDTAAETQLFLAVNILTKPVVCQSILFALKQDFVQEHSELLMVEYAYKTIYRRPGNKRYFYLLSILTINSISFFLVPLGLYLISSSKIEHMKCSCNSQCS